MDLSKLSDADLAAIEAGDFSKMSESALRVLAGNQESDSFKAGRDSSLRGLSSVLQGPTFGFADEIGGAIGGGLKTLFGKGSFGDNYDEMRDFIRGGAAQVKQDTPVIAGVTQAMASAPLLAAKLPLLFKGAGMAARVGNAAATGAGFGALSGAGESTAETAGDIGRDALMGGALGSATSVAAVPVAAAAGGIFGNARARFSDAAAARYAKQKIAEAFARDARGNVAKADPMTALNQAQGRYRQLGDEARVADAGGQNVKQLLDTVATLPGRTKDAVENAIRSRQVGRADRLIGSAEKGLNPSGLRLTETLDDLIERRSEAAGPLYQKLYKSVVRADAGLRDIVAAAESLGAGSTARKISIARQLPYTLDANGKTMAIRDLDHLKQGLDDIIQASIDQTGKMNKTGAAVQELKRALTDNLDQKTGGAYKAARDAFAGPSQLMDAAKAGRKVWSLDDQNITKALRGMSDGEQEAFKLGAFDALRAKLGNLPGQTEVMRMWRDKATREKLHALFGNERGFREFAADVARETRLKALEAVGRGSQTAARQYGAGDLDLPAVKDALGAVTAATSGNVPGFLTGAASAWNQVKTPEPVRDAIGDLLLSQGRGAGHGIKSFEDEMRQVMASRQRQAQGIGMLGGGMTGGLLSR